MSNSNSTIELCLYELGPFHSSKRNKLNSNSIVTFSLFIFIRTNRINTFIIFILFPHTLVALNKAHENERKKCFFFKFIHVTRILNCMHINNEYFVLFCNWNCGPHS